MIIIHMYTNGVCECSLYDCIMMEFLNAHNSENICRNQLKLST